MMSLPSIPKMALALCFLARLDADPVSHEAWISQNLISPLGQVITYETPLYSRTGTMSSVPMNGFLARFDLYVYSMQGNSAETAEPHLVDSSLVGVLPKITMEFKGRDPHPEPRTRVDWEHTVTTRILDGPITFDDPLTVALPGWLTQFVMRKRFLDEEYVGAEDSDDHWKEYTSLPVLHVSANQEITFADNAWPPDLAENQRDSWSGIIEYQLALDASLGCPIPLLTLARMQVRVWPKWRSKFTGFPSEPVRKLPADMMAEVMDIYPASELVVVEYFHDPEMIGDYTSLESQVLVAEPWTASVAQGRQYSLAELSEKREEGNYHVRVGCLLFGEMEYNDDWAAVNATATVEKELYFLRMGLHVLD